MPPPPPKFPRFRSHPMFVEKSFADATETAWARNRLCLVYIAGEKGGGTKAAKVDDAICKALADPEVGRGEGYPATGGVSDTVPCAMPGSCCCGCWSIRRPLYPEGAYLTIPYHTKHILRARRARFARTVSENPFSVDGCLSDAASVCVFQPQP